MISLISLGLTIVTALSSPLAPSVTAKKVDYIAENISTAYVAKAQKCLEKNDVFIYSGESYQSGVLDDLLQFESDNYLIDDDELNNIGDFLLENYSFFDSLNDPVTVINCTTKTNNCICDTYKSNLISTNHLIDTSGSSVGEPSGASSNIPSTLSENQIIDKYGNPSLSVNGLVNGNHFYGIEANKASCVGLYNSMIEKFTNVAAIKACGGVGIIGILLQAVQTLELVPFIAAEMGKISDVVVDFIASIPTTLTGKLIAAAIGIIVLGITALIVAMFFCGAFDHGFRIGIIKYGVFDYEPVCEEIN